MRNEWAMLLHHHHHQLDHQRGDHHHHHHHHNHHHILGSTITSIISKFASLLHQSTTHLAAHPLLRRPLNHHSLTRHSPVFSYALDAQPHPFLSLATALFHHIHRIPNTVAIPHDQQPAGGCDGGCRTSSNSIIPDLNWISPNTNTVEPLTGIEFPALFFAANHNHNHSTFSSQVLVGTGSRTMTIIKIKSFHVYAFGFYVHPNTICQKLGSKYGSVPPTDLKHRTDFYQDLLREDIGMSVRFVVNCSGMKINTVKDAFEKSLRARLAKTNPETDFKCIAAFGSYFKKDIPLPVGTVIDIRRTIDGQLITEIGGNQIGAVRSRELCRAFFDMYLGEVPVSTQTKEEIGMNVASIIGRC